MVLVVVPCVGSAQNVSILQNGMGVGFEPISSFGMARG